MPSFQSLLSELKQQHYAYYIWVMLAPKHARELLLALLSFEAELEAIPTKVSEEMLGLIRFAWWEEAVDMLEAGTLNRDHPVLRALESTSELDINFLKKRLTFHRTHYTEHDHADGEICPNMMTSLIEDCYSHLKQAINSNEVSGSSGREDFTRAKQIKKWYRKASLVMAHAHAGKSLNSPLLMIRLLFK